MVARWGDTGRARWARRWDMVGLLQRWEVGFSYKCARSSPNPRSQEQRRPNCSVLGGSFDPIKSNQAHLFPFFSLLIILISLKITL